MRRILVEPRGCSQTISASTQSIHEELVSSGCRDDIQELVGKLAYASDIIDDIEYRCPGLISKLLGSNFEKRLNQAIKQINNAVR